MANYDECTGTWNVSLTACSGPERCATLDLIFDRANVPANHELPVRDGYLVEASGLRWKLDSAVVHDEIGNFGYPDESQLGKTISFMLTGIALDPDRQLPSWKLLGHVRACSAHTVGCAK
jgi:hypothetical protein